MATAIFDRVDLVRVLDDECFGAPAVSAAVVGGHKVGKSELLRYLHDRVSRSTDAFYCRLDVDSMWANGGMSDEGFLRYFTEELGQQVDAWIADQAADERRWTAEVTDPRTDADIRAALTRRIDELARLRAAQERIRSILEEKEIAFQSLNRVFDHLDRARKKVVLIIDEYDRIVRERAFSDRLFVFLRGANQRKRIVMLVASRVHLMDPSLHPADDPDDRRNHFNHLSARVLAPFNLTEAAEYLRWCSQRDGVNLTEEEILYLVSIGGGLPFFLDQGRKAFIAQGRPAPDARPQFEQSFLWDDFCFRFERIWKDCSSDERGALDRASRGEAGAIAVCPRLMRDGLVVTTSQGARFFSRLFQEFVRTAPPVEPKKPSFAVTRGTEAPVELPQVTVTPVYEVFPTVLSLVTREAGVTRFLIRNQTHSVARLQISLAIDGLAGPLLRVVEVPRGDQQEVVLSPNFGDAAFRLDRATRAQVQWRVTSASNPEGPAVAADTHTLTLLGSDVFVAARYNAADQRMYDYTWLIAAWVSLPEAAFEPLLRTAVNFEPRLGNALPEDGSGQERARANVKALWGVLRSRNFQYHDNPLVFHRQPGDALQRVKKPELTLSSASGNCLDLAVLLASVIARSGMNPGILLVPGHALVGWKYRVREQTRWEFVEPTWLVNRSFEEALAEGNARRARVGEGLKLSQKDGIIDDAAAFAILVDINDVLEQYRVTALG